MVNKIDSRAEIPSDNYVVCVVKKFSVRNSFLSFISFLAFGPFYNYNRNWLLILDSRRLLHVTRLDIDAVPKYFLENCCRYLMENNYEEIEKMYFNVAPEQLEEEFGYLLELSWHESCLVPISGQAS
ncbi:MAG: hypothetical protein ACYC6Z_01150 [Thermoleophilia bacterium]